MPLQSSHSQFYFSTYFITNSLLLLAYPILRIFTSAGRRNLKHSDSFGFSYQNSIIYTVLLMCVMGYMRASSLRGFFVDLFSVGKVGVAALLVFAKFKFSLVYMVVCLIMWVVVPYPKYQTQNRFIKIQSEEHFDQIINKYQQQNNTNNNNKKNKQSHTVDNDQDTQILNYQNKFMCFIQFYADWVMPCILVLYFYIQHKQLWYGYSNRYTTQNLIFLQVNVQKLPQLAKRYKINTSGFSKQLPSLIMVTNGEEEVRFPPVDENNKVSKVQRYDYKALLRYFDIEARYLETRGNVGNSNRYKNQ